MSDDDCPLDLSGWEPGDIIERWRAAYRHANGGNPPTMDYAAGWFRTGSWPQASYRRKSVAAMIWRLENWAKATEDTPT